MPTAAFTNLGCKVNQYETERLAESFEALGFELTDFREPADVYVINTCSVTADADRKSRQMARRAARQKDGAKVVLTGCFAQMALDTGEAVDGATLLVPNAEKMRTASHVLAAFPDLMQYSSSPAYPPAPNTVDGAGAGTHPARLGYAEDGITSYLLPLPFREGEEDRPTISVQNSSLPRFGEGGEGRAGRGIPAGTALFPEAAPGGLISPESLVARPAHRTRATLKIQDGCRYFCGFCSIPYTRNVMASRPFPDVLAEAGQMACAGAKEIVVTGVCVGAYGPQTGSGGQDLADVLIAVADIEGVERVRLSSVQPVEIPDKLIDAMAAHPNIAPHLHLSLQSGDDTILQAMNRPYDTAFFAEIAAKLRAVMPRIGLTTDLIVGYPGETRELFENTLAFAGQMQFARTHVFRYSPRQRTAAAELKDDVAYEEKERRHRELTAVCAASQEAFASGDLGKIVTVLTEAKGAQDGWLSGYTGNYVRVQFAAPASLRGQIVPVRLTEILPGGDAFGHWEEA